MEAMVAALHHRGPDARGIHTASGVALGHTRLAIIDPAGGAQPMHLRDAAGRQALSVVLNGEIFNHVELRAELEAAGRQFHTRSDTEVVLHAFAAWGDAALRRFNGQWALGLWDAQRGRLVLARDRVGIAPLYYAEGGGGVVFASEVKALFAGDPSLRAGLDPIGLEQTLTFWAAIAPRTVFRGICELPPGCARVYEGGSPREEAYFEHDLTPALGGSLADAEAAVRAALERATALRVLRADVPVGCYLSGGLDSSLVAALGLAAKGEPLHTFSLRFADAEYDETRYQRLVAAALGTDHHEVVVTGDDIARAFPAVIRHAERPLLRTAPAPLFLLSRLVASAGIKVVLTGEGADEMFAGYDLFREGVILRFWAREPASRQRPRLLQRLYPYLARSPVGHLELAKQFFGGALATADAPGATHATRWRAAGALRRLLAPSHRVPADVDVVGALLAALPPAHARWSPLARDQYLEIHTLLGPYLLGSQGDRMLMAHGVEGRFPFLDPDVVAVAHALPDSAKLRVLDEKHVLKRVARQLVPPEIVARRKQPYRAPDAAAFASPRAQAELEELLSAGAVVAAGALDPAAVAALWRKCKAGLARGALSSTDNMALVFAVSTQLLCRELLGAG
jgi:asparagine synthase (glutamine-hydrolysing)